MPRRRRKKVLPQGLFEAEIESLSHDGRGIAHIDGKVLFIDGALPEEKVSFEYSYQRKQFDEGIAREIHSASPDRVEAPCEFADRCGGCSLQHISNEKQINFKQATLIEQFTHIAGVTIPELLAPLPSPSLGYRRKARLAVKYVPKKQKVLVGFREKRNTFIADIDRCEVLTKEVGHRLHLIAELIKSLNARTAIPQIEVAKGDDSAVALIFRHLEPLGEEDIVRLKGFCKQYNFHLYLQAKGPDTVMRLPLTEDKVVESEATGHEQSNLPMRLHYALPSHDVAFDFHPCDFTQVNGDINRDMINRVINLFELNEQDVVLDLFCGLGNFSLPMAKQIKQLIGVEGSEMMVQRASENAEKNVLNNCQFYRLDLEQNLQVLKQDPQSWLNIPFNKMLIDPPRSGALTVVENIELFAQVEHLIYVSCNPATLARDSAVLLEKGFQLESAGIMDMFPHTNHVESLAVFKRNK